MEITRKFLSPRTIETLEKIYIINDKTGFPARTSDFEAHSLYLTALLRAGLTSRVAKGQYVVTDEGEDYLQKYNEYYEILQ